MYIHFNPNPIYEDKSIAWSNGDCVIRSVACAMDWTWQQAYIYCCNSSMSVCDMPNSVRGFRRVMEDLRGERVIINEKRHLSVAQFMKEHPTGTYIMSVEGPTGHVVCGKNGDWYDAFDSSNFLVYGYHIINPPVKEPQKSFFQKLKEKFNSL